MRPLDLLASTSSLAHLLRSAAAPVVRAEIARAAALPLEPGAAAALAFARGALSLREGALDAARVELGAAADALAALGEAEAADLARCEALLAVIRRGPRAAYAEAIDALEAIAATRSGRVRVVALHYRGAAERAAGDAAAAQRTLLEAFRGAEPFLAERAQILNSLGTLYVVLGASGAATALLEHAAELHHQGGDATGEAIAHGQLGAVALALGDLDRARKHLQRQEWLASRMGDPLGRARALTFLADVALEAGRAADAAELAGFALDAARSVDPELALWVAYATRALGRARMELGDHDRARADLEAARAAFARFGNPLGLALAEQDLARAAAGDGSAWFAPAWALGSLGLGARVARLLTDRRVAAASPDGDGRDGAVLAAVAQSAPHLAAADEVALVYSAPEALAAIATRRTAAQRNLGRLAALAIARPGLVVAALAADSIGEGRRALPPERAAAAAVAELPGVAVWVWPLRATPEEIGRDLAAARAALGEDTRAVLVLRPRARVLSPPFQGEVGAEVEGVDAVPLVRAVGSLDEAELVRGVDVPWCAEAEGRVAMAGFVARQEMRAARD